MPSDLASQLEALTKATGRTKSFLTVEALRARAGWLGELCKLRGYRYAPRLHVELYGNRADVLSSGPRETIVKLAIDP